MSTRLTIRVKKKAAAVEESGKSVLAFGAPQEWHWAYYRSQVQWRGRFRLFHVLPRFQAEAAKIAGQHGLSFSVIDSRTHG